MSGYVGKVQIGGNTALVGSTSYGICTTFADVTAKRITASEDNSGNFINNHFTSDLIYGTTIHIKFIRGNSVISGMTLLIGDGNNIQAHDVVGKCICDPNTIISFTYDENQHWVVNDNVNTEYVFKS